jgi:hypothetical protein
MNAKVLIACEESQTVCKAFRDRGFEAYSCDIQEPSGNHPEWHILGDALEAIKAEKTTCLWLKNLPLLMPTDVVSPGEILHGGYSVGASANYATDENGKILRWNDPLTAKARSKTFPGIAEAMAEQWGCLL